jgi:hypothetical protein
MKPLACLLLLAGLTVCGPPDRLEARAPSRSAAPIVNGTLETNPAYRVVGMIFVHAAGSGSGFLCSATLIAPNVALTAGHCTTDEQNNQIDFTSGATVGEFLFGPNPFNGTPEATIPIRSLVKFPAYTGPPDFKNDIGIVVLARDVSAEGYVPFPYAQSHVNQLDTGGVTLHFVGYGITSTHANDAGVKRFADIPVPAPHTSVCANVGYDPQFQFCDGDGVHATCSGDSGGPAILALNGVPTIVGVTSFGSAASCQAFGVDTRVDTYKDFIDFQISHAPKAENCSNGVDDDGDGLIDCVDPDCADSPACNPSGNGSTRAQCQVCSATAPCAAGLTCIKPLHSSSTGICEAACGPTVAAACGAGQVCASFPSGDMACSCGRPVGAEGEGCFTDHPCSGDLVCSASGTCRQSCSGGGTCPTGRACNGATCEPIPATTTTTTTTGSSHGSTGTTGTPPKSGGCGSAGGAGLSLLALLGAALLVRRRD